MNAESNSQEKYRHSAYSPAQHQHYRTDITADWMREQNYSHIHLNF
jgi:hypothetical protein